MKEAANWVESYTKFVATGLQSLELEKVMIGNPVQPKEDIVVKFSEKEKAMMKENVRSYWPILRDMHVSSV